MLFYELIDKFNEKNLEYAVVGGYALALHGIVRATMNVDFVLHLRLPDYQLVESSLAELGLQSRHPLSAEDIIKMRLEYIERRNLLAWSFVDYKNPTRQVDILLTKDLRKIKVEIISVAGRKVSVASLSELLKMKSETGRPQDLIDVQLIQEKLNGKKRS